MPSHTPLDQELRRADAKAKLAVQDGQAARTVAARAKDVDDCRVLLAMLGLDPAGTAAPTA